MGLMKLDRLEITVRRARVLALLLLVAAIAVYAVWFFVLQRLGLSDDPSDWGAFGDFVGGLLNPFFAFMAFYWLTVSVVIQKAELSETRDALIESRDAQRQLATSTEKAMQMQALNIQLQAVDTQLRALFDYQAFVLVHGSGQNINYELLTKTGRREKAENLVRPLSEEIAKLQAEQQVLIEQARRIANGT
jgi:hypothetical protein